MILLLGQLANLPGHRLRYREADLPVLIPLRLTFENTTDEEIGHLARVVAIAHPVECLPLVPRERQVECSRYSAVRLRHGLGRQTAHGCLATPGKTVACSNERR